MMDVDLKVLLEEFKKFAIRTKHKGILELYETMIDTLEYSVLLIPHTQEVIIDTIITIIDDIIKTTKSILNEV
jgi:hypothetical protein